MRLAFCLIFYGPYQVVVCLYLLFYSLKNKEFRRSLRERIFFKASAFENIDTPIWIHSASVGELKGVEPLVREILKNQPSASLIFTSTSVTGLIETRKLYPDRFSTLLPIDVFFVVANFIKKMKPKLLIINETELWPQLIIQTDKFEIPILLVNGRISDRTFPSYKKLRPIFSFLLEKISLFCVQTELDQERFISIGADEGKIAVVGNTKFDADIQDHQNRELEDLIQEFKASTDFSISFGSIREEEEEIIYEALNKLFKGPDSYSVLVAARHPKRFAPFCQKLDRLGVPLIQRSDCSLSKIRSISAKSRIFYLDSLGEMLSMYKHSDLAFVGGTYSNVGGHNILEPAYFGVPVVTGPRIESQRDAYFALNKLNAILVVDNNLGQSILELLSDQKELEMQGQRAYSAFTLLQGASHRLYLKINEYLS